MIQTIRDVARLVWRMKLQHPILGLMTLDSEVRSDHEIEVVVTMLAPDRDARAASDEAWKRWQLWTYGGKLDTVPAPVPFARLRTSVTIALAPLLGMADDDALRQVRWVVRDLLRRSLEHEIDEMFLVDGERVDPHANGAS